MLVIDLILASILSKDYKNLSSMKKLLYLTILTTILIYLINVFSFYLFNYPDDSEILTVISYYSQWRELLVVYFLILSISILLSLFLFKRHKFLKKFYISIICLNIILFIFISIKAINSFIENKKYLDEIVTEFRQNAENDIKNDNVKYFSQGLLIPPRSKKDSKKADKANKFLKKYGLNHKSLGCIISPHLTKAQEEYKKITDVYLEKRNGKNWRNRMRKQIDSINSGTL
jgi:hypothetical protein